VPALTTCACSYYLCLLLVVERWAVSRVAECRAIASWGDPRDNQPLPVKKRGTQYPMLSLPESLPTSHVRGHGQEEEPERHERTRTGRESSRSRYVRGRVPSVLALPLPFVLRFLQTRERRTSPVLTHDHPHQSTHRVVDLARRYTIEGGNGGYHTPNPHIALERPHPVFTHDIPAKSRSLSNCPPPQAKPRQGAHMAARSTEGARDTSAAQHRSAQASILRPASRSALSRGDIVSPRVALLQVLMVGSRVFPGLALGLGVRHIGHRIVFIIVLQTAGIDLNVRWGEGSWGARRWPTAFASVHGWSGAHAQRSALRTGVFRTMDDLRAVTPSRRHQRARFRRDSSSKAVFRSFYGLNSGFQKF
jgi:hypothetical protein